MINIDDRLLDSVDQSELFLLCHIVKRLNRELYCFPSNKTLLKDTGWAIEKLQKVKKTLVDLGYLSIDQRFSPLDRQTTNGYTVKTSLIGAYLGGNRLSVPPENPTPTYGKSDTTEGAENPTIEVLTREEVLKTESDDSVPKDLFEDKASEKEEKDKERKRIFIACRDFWLTEVHKGWRFDGVEGKALKGILESGRKHFNKNHEREPSEEEMVNSFKHLCLKLSPYYSSKKLRHINQDFDIILDEMKTGNSKKLRGNSQVSIFSKYRQL